MLLARKVINGLTVGTLVKLTGASQVDIQMHESRKRPFPGLRSLQIGIRRCRARVRPHDGLAIIASLRWKLHRAD